MDVGHETTPVFFNLPGACRSLPNCPETAEFPSAEPALLNHGKVVFGEVRPDHLHRLRLSVHAALSGDFVGDGLDIIFRPGVQLVPRHSATPRPPGNEKETLPHRGQSMRRQISAEPDHEGPK
jgi:hypothetical protein